MLTADAQVTRAQDALLAGQNDQVRARYSRLTASALMGRLRLGPALARCLASWLIFRLTKTLRHYLATRFLEKNQGDIATLATVLGHANISTTTRYLHPNARRVQEMVEEM